MEQLAELKPGQTFTIASDTLVWIVTDWAYNEDRTYCVCLMTGALKPLLNGLRVVVKS